jgi:hypothetical protein
VAVLQYVAEGGSIRANIVYVIQSARWQCNVQWLYYNADWILAVPLVSLMWISVLQYIAEGGSATANISYVIQSPSGSVILNGCITPEVGCHTGGATSITTWITVLVGEALKWDMVSRLDNVVLQLKIEWCITVSKTKSAVLRTPSHRSIALRVASGKV